MEELRPHFSKVQPKEEVNKNLYNERLELYNDPDFDRQYYIPQEYFNEFLNNPDFDFKYFSLDSHKQRRYEKERFMNTYFEEVDNIEYFLIQEKYDTFNEENYHYKLYFNNPKITIEDYKKIREEVRDILFLRYNENYIEPYPILD